jgi:hypothetical protein
MAGAGFSGYISSSIVKQSVELEFGGCIPTVKGVN